MIFFQKLKAIYIERPACRQAGMTYVELIVVLSIFAVMSSIVLFNYGKFQAKVDIKNLGSDIALKFVEAQKSAVAGKLYAGAVSTWRPSYGLRFDLLDKTSFIYFADLNNNNLYDINGSVGCQTPAECISQIALTKGNAVGTIHITYLNGTSEDVNDLNVIFTRPNAGATIKFTNMTTPSSNISYVAITINSPQSVSTIIRIYTSGRIQIL